MGLTAAGILGFISLGEKLGHRVTIFFPNNVRHHVLATVA